MDHTIEQLEAEVRRLRDRAHRLESTTAAHDLLLTDLRRRLDATATTVDAMTDADKIAAAIAEHDKERRTVRFTVWQKVLGLALAGVTFADFVLRLHAAGVFG